MELDLEPFAEGLRDEPCDDCEDEPCVSVEFKRASNHSGVYLMTGVELGRPSLSRASPTR